MLPVSAPDLPLVVHATPASWEAFLEREGASAPGVWLQIAKKGCGEPSVTYAEALDSALCWGWIDSQKGAVDDRWFKQRFTPRKAGSRWSKINVEHVERLTAAGRMREPGLREVEAAKADGRWAAAYAGARTIEVPDDLRTALDADALAAAEFTALDGANRYAILYRVHEAKRVETRAKRIEQFVAMLARGERIHPAAAKERA